MYAKPENGGIGLFDLKNFISALQSTWAKRAFQCCNDNWKFDLISTYENCPHKVGFFNNSLGKTLTILQKVSELSRKTLRKLKATICTLQFLTTFYVVMETVGYTTLKTDFLNL